MCYFNSQKVIHEEYLRLKGFEKAVANYSFLNRDVINGFDFGNTAVLKANAKRDDFDIVQMEWGFLPDPGGWPFIETREQAWQVRRGYKDARGKWNEPLNFLNAVGEEILFKNKVYRKAALERRCIIPSTGFYEWRHIFPKNKRTGEPVKTAVKYPYRIHAGKAEYFWLAGIWQNWTDAATGETIDTCAVVTTSANLVMEQIHNSKKRMPTMLTDDLAYEWLFGALDEKQISAIAQWQIQWEELSYYTLAKDFLSSTDPMKEVVQPDLPPLTLPGIAAQPEGQISLF